MFNALTEIKNTYDYSDNKLVLDFTELQGILEEKGKVLSYDNLQEVISILEGLTKASVIITDVPPNVELREIDAKDINLFFSTTVMIKTITEINPIISEEVYVCPDCKTYYTNDSKNGNQKTVPSKCSCGTPLIFDKKQTDFRDEKYLTLEEPLELRKDGLSRSFRAHLTGYEASSAYNLKAGDVCLCSGVVDIEKETKNKDNLRFILEINHIQPVSYSFDDIELEEEDIQRIKELSLHENLFDELVDSLAPEIFGCRDEKEGMVLQLFEGNRDYEKERSFMHLLLIGEPGLAKSKLVNSVKNIAPKVIVTSGTNATKVGLTVSTNRDELTGKWTADAGAVVLGDSGVLVIDEFDKLPYDAKTSINEPMESGTVSLSKAGLTQTLTSRSSILAAANPRYGHYDDYKPLRDQLEIPDSTLSRFDLVYLMKDVVDEEKDRELGMRILNSENDEMIPPVEPELFRNYIAYAKANFNPRITSESAEILNEFYVQVRQDAAKDDDSKPITARDLNAIRRLASAHAKVYLKNEIDKEDVQKAISVYCASLETLGLTPNTAEEIRGAFSKKEIDAIDYLEELMRDYIEEFNYVPNPEELKKEVQNEYELHESVASRLYDEAYAKMKR